MVGARPPPARPRTRAEATCRADGRGARAQGHVRRGTGGEDTTPSSDTHGDFAEGQEQEHHEPEEVEKGTFAEGEADEDEHPGTPERGDFAAGQEREDALIPILPIVA